MRKMKKLVATTVACSLLGTMLVGCGAGTSGSNAGSASTDKESVKEAVKLKFWGAVPEESGPKMVCDAFNEQYKDKGIEVEYVRFVNDSTGNMKLESALLAGSDVDVFISYGTETLNKRTASNMMFNMKEYMEKDSFDAEAIVGSIVNEYNTEDEVYSIPTVQTRSAIAINVDMFKAAGIEIPTAWTFDEFREIAKKLTSGEGQDKVYGMFWNTAAGMTYGIGTMASIQLGGGWSYVDDYESNYTNPTVVGTANLVGAMMNEDGTAVSHTDTVTQKLSQESVFLSGQSAMTVGAWIARTAKDTAQYPHDFVTGLVPFPTLEEGGQVYSDVVGGDLLSINAKSKHPEEAWEFIKWYITEGMEPMAEFGGRIPLANTYDAAKITELFIKGGEEVLDKETIEANFINTPDLPVSISKFTNKPAELSKIFNEEIEGVYMGKTTSQDAMEKAKERADAILNE